MIESQNRTNPEKKWSREPDFYGIDRIDYERNNLNHDSLLTIPQQDTSNRRVKSSGVSSGGLTNRHFRHVPRAHEDVCLCGYVLFFILESLR